MIRYLLDTSTVSGPARPRPDRRLVDRFTRFASSSAIAAPVWHELRYGMLRLQDGRRKRDLAKYLTDVAGSMQILPYDAEAADWHAHERDRLQREGIAVPDVDGQIASIARTNDLVVVTANVRDFARFDVDVEDWSSKR